MEWTPEKLAELPEHLRGEIEKLVAKNERVENGESREFGAHLYSIRVGQSGNCVSMTRRPKTGATLPKMANGKSTYLVTNFRPSQILELRPNGGSVFEWMAQFVEREVEAERLAFV